MLKIMAITPEHLEEKELFKKTEELLKSGIHYLQYRDKKEGFLRKKALAEKLLELCKKYDTPLIINDDVTLAKELGCGVHLGQEDFSISEARKLLGNVTIGATAHNLAEALKAKEEGADYLGCGALYPTTSKDGTTPLSLEELETIIRGVGLPVYAIGGIRAKHLREILPTGVEGVALISSVFYEDELEVFKRPPVLSIAGSDPSGGAGIQADLKTFSAFNTYGMAAITSLTAQNTTGVTSIHTPPSSFLSEQLESIFTDIPPVAIKVGMLGTKENLLVLEEVLEKYPTAFVVFDPVMVSTSGSVLLEEGTERLLYSLLRKAYLITPNIPEAEALTGITIKDKEDMVKASSILYEMGIKNILLKGGHLKDSKDDLLYLEGEAQWLEGTTIETTHTHGTGCTLSSAITSLLAKGYSLTEAVTEAKLYVRDLLSFNYNLGEGHGPLYHPLERNAHETNE